MHSNQLHLPVVKLLRAAELAVVKEQLSAPGARELAGTRKMATFLKDGSAMTARGLA